LFVRIPGWVKSAKVSVNEKSVEGAKSGQYLAIRRQWSPDDTVMLKFPMTTEVLASNPRISENRGRVAVQRGPMVYCMEQIDQPNMPAMADVAIMGNPPVGKAFQAEHKADLLDGVTVLHHNGAVSEVSSSKEALYLPASAETVKTKPQNLTLIPYYAWANREPTGMQVWVAYTRA
jgi:uncharacterized protein